MTDTLNTLNVKIKVTKTYRKHLENMTRHSLGDMLITGLDIEHEFTVKDMQKQMKYTTMVVDMVVNQTLGFIQKQLNDMLKINFNDMLGDGDVIDFIYENKELRQLTRNFTKTDVVKKAIKAAKMEQDGVRLGHIQQQAEALGYTLVKS